MSKILQIEELMLRSRRLPWLVWGVVLGILALAILLTARPVRAGIREQMIQREGEILYAVVVAQLDAMRLGQLEEDPADPVTQLTALLSLQNLKGVLGIRLFDPDGGFVVSFPGTLWEQEVPLELRDRLANRQPVSMLVPPGPLARQFYPETAVDLESAQGTALLEVYVPLHTAADAQLLGVAEFVLDGSRMVEEFTRLDRGMIVQATVNFVAVSLLLGLVMVWAIRRLNRLHGELGERTRSLLLANAELALAARTTALGAITSHLVHGLRSPLAGLQNLVTSGGQASTMPGPEDWAEAQSSMRRMQALIREVVQVLHDHPVEEQYRVSFDELGQEVMNRVEGMARQKGVQLETRGGSEDQLDNRAANLVMLILTNLLENAIQATPGGKRVEFSITPGSEATVCRVRDEGAGIPENVRSRLFSPTASTKEGGSGLGLAISHQLAQHLDARLGLVESGEAGSVFELVVLGAVRRAKTVSGVSGSVTQVSSAVMDGRA